jgi:IMP dehydrogenase
MKEYNNKEQLCFDDILMVPQHSDIESRRQINLTMKLGSNATLDLPVIAAPMDTVCETEMAIVMAQNGGVGILHRFMSIWNQVEMVKQASKNGLAVGASVGAKGDYLDDVKKLVDAGACVILVDTANGHSEYAINAVSQIRESFPTIHIMAGNVATSSGFLALSKAGANSIRVGIGGGSVCTTRIVSGHGVPTLASVIDCKKIKEEHSLDTAIIADGGIRNTGDMIKAFAAGADAVMVGSMLAGTEEAPGSVMINENGKYKAFRGMASREANEGKDIAVAEGASTLIKYKGSVLDILSDIKGGLGSGCSYSGVKNLSDLYENSLYIKVSSNTVGENKPHAQNL